MSPNKAHKTFGPNSWWWRDFKTALEKNAALRFWAYWLSPGIRSPGPLAVAWSPLEQQAIEFLFWLYEVDARNRGEYLFGVSVAQLGWEELTEITRPAHPLKGCLPRWMNLAQVDHGRPLGVKGDKIAYPTPYSHTDRIHESGYLAWTHVKDAQTGQVSKSALTINLHCSDRSIYNEFKHRRDEIGIMPSRRRLFTWLKKLRSEFCIPAPKSYPQKGERRRRVKWWHVECLESASPLEASRASEARSQLKKCDPAIRAWEECAQAVGYIRSHRQHVVR